MSSNLNLFRCVCVCLRADSLVFAHVACLSVEVVLQQFAGITCVSHIEFTLKVPFVDRLMTQEKCGPVPSAGVFLFAAFRSGCLSSRSADRAVIFLSEGS